jgi:hypothetical protein
MQGIFGSLWSHPLWNFVDGGAEFSFSSGRGVSVTGPPRTRSVQMPTTVTACMNPLRPTIGTRVGRVTP